jgi:hypothetical protein
MGDQSMKILDADQIIDNGKNYIRYDKGEDNDRKEFLPTHRNEFMECIIESVVVIADSPDIKRAVLAY